MDVSQGSRGGGRDISLETIVEKAIAMADVDGLAALSLRKIANELGVAPMTLYGYVRSKDDLLGQMASHALAAFEVPSVTSDDWTEHLRALLCELRALLLRHPCLVALLTTRRVTSIGLTRLAEAVLAHLQKAGASREDGVRAYATLFTYTVGFVSFELPRAVHPVPDRETSDLSVQRQLEAHAAARRFPHVQESVTELSRIAEEQTFEFGLRAIVDGLASRAGR